MVRKKAVLTQLEIVQQAAKLMFENGYTATSANAVSKEVGISPGNMTYYFPTKEHLLAVLIELLAEFQWRTAREVVYDGETAITALCFELVAMAAICDEDEVARDLYIAAYTNRLSLEVIRKNDAKRAKEVFKEFCPTWTDEMFDEAETLVSGIEYASLMVTENSPPIEVRIAGAMNQILAIYNVPEERRKKKTQRALSLDYHSYARQLFDSFKNYVLELTEKSFDDWAKNRSNSLIELL